MRTIVPDSAIPAGWRHNPSAWSRRIPMVALALAACGIASYLALYQLQIVRHVWDPLFGEGSRRILRDSWVARILPVPDASVGAIAYLTDALLGLVGSSQRWRTRPAVVLLFAANVAALGLTGAALLLAQPLLFHAGCTLCIVSSALSLLMVWPAAQEVIATIRHLHRVKAIKGSTDA